LFTKLFIITVRLLLRRIFAATQVTPIALTAGRILANFVLLFFTSTFWTFHTPNFTHYFATPGARQHKKFRKFVLYLSFDLNPLSSHLHWRCRDDGESMSVIRSSDIGNYLYCRRAWWYKKQGFESENQTELAFGTEIHRQHGRKVL